MPIIGVTDTDHLEERYPLVGRLYKGAAKPERGPGRDQPTFRFESHSERAKQAFAAAFGDAPERLRAILPYETLHECFPTWIEAWDRSGRMLWRSDKERSVRRWLEDQKAYSDRERDQLPHEQLPRQDLAQWKGRLFLLFPELLSAGHVGAVMLGTSGKHDITRIAAALAKLEKQCRQAGRPNGMAFVEVILERRKMNYADPDGSRRDHYDVFLFPAEEWVQAQLEAARQEMLAQLPANVRVVDEETGEIIYEREGTDVEPIETVVRPQRVVSDSPGVVPKAARAQADPAPQARAEAPVTNGKPATLKGCSKWRVRVNEFADDNPEYAPDGNPDMARILAELGARGYAEITDENLDTALDALVVDEATPEEAEAEPVDPEDVPF